MLKKLALCLLILQSFNSQCQTGCLRCENSSPTDSTKICVLCDTLNNYYHNDANTCVQSDITNCELLSNGNTCLVCSAGYYLNQTTKTCVAIQTINKINNCQFYADATTCLFCNKGYFISAKSCTKVTTPIVSCEFYQSQTKCLVCEDNYVLNDDSTVCTKLPTTCLQYSEFTCVKCKNQYVLNQNLYKLSSYKWSTQTERDSIIEYLYLFKYQNNTLSNKNVCQKTILKNCVDFANFSKCNACASGYYLTKEFVCLPFPYPVITQCQIYAYLTASKQEYKCFQCVQGYFLESNKKCKAVTAIDNCVNYSPTSSTSVCIQCDEDHYLSASGTQCNARSIDNINIAGCATYAFSQDTCATCETEKIISNDGRLCLTEINNCLIHNNFSSAANQNQLTCSKCDYGFYYGNDNTTCEQGTVDNCYEYIQTVDTCTVCDDQFYPNNTCLNKHANIDECIDYSPTSNKYCHQCSANQHPLQIKKICQSVGVPQSNCIGYFFSNNNTEKTCTFCDTGYYLDGNNNCESVPANCKAANVSGVCTQCIDGYYLFTNQSNNNIKICVATPDYITSDCDSFDLTNNNDYDLYSIEKCDVCSPYKSFLDSPSTHICLETSYLDYLGLSITNYCIKADISGVCEQCAPGYYLNQNGNSITCTSTCNTAISPIKLPDQSGDGYDFRLNYCMDAAQLLQDNANGASDPQTRILSQDLKSQNTGGDEDQYPFACRGQVNIAAFTGRYTNIKVSNTISQTQVVHPADVWPEVQCPSFDPTDYYNSITPIGNLSNLQLTTTSQKLYHVKTNWTINNKNLYYTIKCDWGFVGSFTSLNDNTSTVYYLNCDNTQSTQNFSVSTYYYGIQAHWSNFFSVHKCSSDGKIPVLAFVGNDTNDQRFDDQISYGFDTATNADFDTASTKQKNIVCLDVSTSQKVKDSLMLDSSISLNNVAGLTNCGLGFLNLNKEKQNFNNSGYTLNPSASRVDKEDLGCAACKPGYKQYENVVGGGANDFLRRNCVKIDFCNTDATNNNIFDACGQCNSGYTWKYDNNRVHYDICIKVPTSLSNCLAFEATNNGAPEGNCAFCAKGYYLNADEHCELISVANCQSFVKNQKFGDIGMKNYLQQTGVECAQCNTGFISMEINTPATLCYSGTYLTTTVQNFSALTDGSSRGIGEFINYCTAYYTSKYCKACTSGYILTQNNEMCLKISSNDKLLNCEIANNTGTNCFSCDQSYGLTANGCVLGQVSNCVTYNQQTTQASPQCQECDSTYFLQSVSSCVNGKIPNCKTFSTITTCTECAENYWLVHTQNNQFGHYCIPVDSTLNCEDVDFSQNSDNSNLVNVSCTNSCVDHHMTTFDVVSTSQTSITSKCYDISLGSSANCEIYDNQSMSVNSWGSFLCTHCDEKYYLNTDNNYQCLERSKTDYSNCKVRALNADLCQECKDSFYLNSNATTCTAYPDGIYGCIEYDNSLNCTKCDQYHFLTNNTCTEVVSANRISQCYLYASSSECKICNTNYFLTNPTTCDLISVSNCAVAESKDSCLTCNQNYKIKVVSGKNTCEVITVTNCSEIDEATSTCTTCDRDYYVNDSGKCSKANPIINNCFVMNNATQCLFCDQQFALSNNGTLCLSKTGIDPNCQDTKINSSYTCSACQGGYSFVNGVCTKNTRATIENGCFEEDVSGNCLFCVSGFSMGINGSCTNNNPPAENSGISKMNIFIGILFMILFQVN